MKPSEWLKKTEISRTPLRVELLNIFSQATRPLSQKEIESQVAIAYDRATLYRNLRLFIEKNIIHRISVSENLVAYKLQEPEVREEKEHLHFHCKQCHLVFCMPQFKIAEYNLPQGFTKTDSHFVIDGFCNTCNQHLT